MCMDDFDKTSGLLNFLIRNQVQILLMAHQEALAKWRFPLVPSSMDWT